MNELSYKLFFKAISNKTRFEIVALLRKGSKSVTAICSGLGFEQSRVSHNLKCLVDCGFVNCAYNGKNKIYSLDTDVLAIMKAIDKHLVKYHERLRRCGVLEEHTASSKR